MRTIYVVKGEEKYDHTEILTAYSVKAEASSFVSTCEEYDKLEPKGYLGWRETDKTRYAAWRNAFDTWAKKMTVIRALQVLGNKENISMGNRSLWGWVRKTQQPIGCVDE